MRGYALPSNEERMTRVHGRQHCNVFMIGKKIHAKVIITEPRPRRAGSNVRHPDRRCLLPLNGYLDRLPATSSLPLPSPFLVPIHLHPPPPTLTRFHSPPPALSSHPPPRFRFLFPPSACCIDFFTRFLRASRSSAAVYAPIARPRCRCPQRARTPWSPAKGTRSSLSFTARRRTLGPKRRRRGRGVGAARVRDARSSTALATRCYGRPWEQKEVEEEEEEEGGGGRREGKGQDGGE